MCMCMLHVRVQVRVRVRVCVRVRVRVRVRVCVRVRHLGVEARLELPLAQAVECEVVGGHQPRHDRVVVSEQVGLYRW